MSIQILNFIGGEHCEAVSAKYLTSVNPATGLAISNVPDSDERDVEKAVDAAKVAFESWSKTTCQERSKILMRIADLIEMRLEEFAAAESQDQGKPLKDARSIDIPRYIRSPF